MNAHTPTEITTDLAVARQQLTEQGYCIVANALDKDAVQALRMRLVTQADHEKRLGHAFEDGGPAQQWGTFIDRHGKPRAEAFTEAGGGVNQRVWMLVNKGQVFIDLLSHTDVMALVGHVLGENFLLSSHTANIAKPGGVEMPLHTDQWWMPQPTEVGRRNLPVGSITRTRFDLDDAATANNTDIDVVTNFADDSARSIAPAACANVIWMLDDFTIENGATRIVPGSHMAGRHPRGDDARRTDIIQACAPAGSALITDGRLWHGTGANSGNGNRNAVLTTFCGPQFRPQENFVTGTRKQVVDNASPHLLALLGFKVWWGYGRTGHPTVEVIDREQTPLGILGDDS